MGTVFRFLANYEGLIYIFLALGALFTVRQIIRSWYEVREAVFGLEREYAVRRLSQAIALTVFLGALFILELIIASFVAPALPSAGVLATPTLNMVQNSGEPSLSEPSRGRYRFSPFQFAIGCPWQRLHSRTINLHLTGSGSGSERHDHFGRHGQH